MKQLDNFEVFPSQDDSYVAIHGEIDRKPVNVRVPSTAFDDLARRGTSTDERKRFVRHNLGVFRAITQEKIESGDKVDEDWHGRSAIALRIELQDIEKYTREHGIRLSDAALDPRRQARWV